MTKPMNTDRTHFFVCGHDLKLFDLPSIPNPYTIVDLSTIDIEPSIAENRFYLSQYAEQAMALNQPIALITYRFDEKFKRDCPEGMAGLSKLPVDDNTIWCPHLAPDWWLWHTGQCHHGLDKLVKHVARKFRFMGLCRESAYCNNFVCSPKNFRLIVERWRQVYYYTKINYNISHLPFRVRPANPKMFLGRTAGLYFERVTTSIISGLHVNCLPVPVPANPQTVVDPLGQPPTLSDL
jgi:hypothetical protein